MKVYGILEGIVEDTQRPAGSHRVTRCVGKLTFVQRVTEDNMGATTVSVEQLSRDEALSVAGVTRCRNCKHFEAGYTDGVALDGDVCWAWNNGHDYPSWTHPDGFCHRGERIEVDDA